MLETPGILPRRSMNASKSQQRRFRLNQQACASYKLTSDRATKHQSSKCEEDLEIPIVFHRIDISVTVSVNLVRRDK